ncbi:MAG: AMP-binding protein [Syntrophomonadaceae bacterium]|nr:AMP-binding protein [Syntrophomonadaceae bacterium]
MDMTNVVEILAAKALDEPEGIPYTFLNYKDGTRCDINISYREAYDNARRIAADLQEKGIKKGDRVIVFATQTSDNVYSLYGALMAGAVFVLVPPPIDEPKVQRFSNILASSGAKFILCNTPLFRAAKTNPVLRFIHDAVTVINVEEIDTEPAAWVKGGMNPDDLAYLQYSSGSTSVPKGIMISQRNVMHNMASLAGFFKDEPFETAVSWVPFFHNIGLVAFLFFNVFYHFRSVIMSPQAFMEKPVRWLEAISEFKAYTTAGPNSAYALCAKIAKEEDLKRIDLSSLKCALNGSEPIDSQSLKMFSLKFGPSGFDSLAFCPAYGLAESTMFVAGNNRKIPVREVGYAQFQKNLLAEDIADDGRKKEIISVGKVFNHSKVAVVDPDSGRVCSENEIGEIWLQSESVADGYWDMPEENGKTFRGILADHPGFYLRTGDLGAVSGGELYITGRCKELIIINGHNIYPQDIERNIKEDIKDMAPCAMSVFPVRIQGKERVVIGIEANTEGLDTQSLIEEIRNSVHRHFEVSPFEVFFVREGGLPRTDNGKIQMFKVKENYESKRLFTMPDALLEPENVETAKAKSEITDEVELKIKKIFGQIIETGEGITAEDSFFSLGGDSLDTVHLLSSLEEEFEVTLILKDVVEKPTIRGIAEHIKKIMKREDIVNDKTYLYADCELPEDIIPGPYQYSDISCPQNVFLTGSTGFLGAYLIKELMEHTQADLYCHVRADNKENGLARIKGNMEKYKIWADAYAHRIKPVLGDLTKPLLGIEPGEYGALAGMIDTIYHNGALLNFIFPYNHLKKTNVDGTIECLRLACREKTKYFHYISTFSVYDNPSHFQKPALEDDPLTCGEGYFLGYSETKWVSEKLVRAAEQRGLKATIYRPGDITGDSKNGIWEMSDLVSRVLNACIQMEAIPDINVNIYITPVDFISRAVVALSTREDSPGKAFNVINKDIAGVKELQAIINNLGYQTKLMPYKEWQKMLFKATDNNVLKILESLFAADESEETAIVRRYGDMEPDFDTTNIRKGLAGTGIQSPMPDMSLMYKYLLNFAAKGHIKYPVE